MSDDEAKTWKAAAYDRLVSSVPEVTRQQLLESGFNVWGLDLFIESIARKKDAKTFDAFAFKHRGIKITMEPYAEVDTRHY